MSLLARQTRLPRYLEEWLLGQIGRARVRLVDLRAEHPAANTGELARHLIDAAKARAVRSGAVTGLFGLAAVPADVAFLAYLELTLAIELAVLFEVNLKTPGGRQQLLDLLGWERGVTPLALLAPALTARLGRAIVRRSAWRVIGRGVPLVATPLAAWLNHREIQRIGDAAVLSFGAFGRLHATAPQPTDAREVKAEPQPRGKR